MKIEILFPEICNLYADLQNIEYLKRCDPSIEIIHTDLNRRPLFLDGGIKLVYVGTTTERGQELVIKSLMPYRDEIVKSIEDGQFFLLTGNASEMFGKFIKCDDGSEIKCLDILPTYAVRDMMHRYNSLWIGQYGQEDVVGFKSQFTQCYFTEGAGYGDTYKPLFIAERGEGLHPGIKEEGIRWNNLFMTYLLGPLFIVNPLFTHSFLEIIGAENTEIAYKDASMRSFLKRCKEFREPERGFTY
ncbi:MAG: hypothetical protein IKE53_04715 [Clostridiales bacterium]|nr:hypothetical protein [Clostridiales bacterium]